MADYSRQIDALNNAIASGVLSTTIDGTTIRYSSLEEMIQRVQYLERLQSRGSLPRRGRTLLNPIDLRNIT